MVIFVFTHRKSLSAYIAKYPRSLFKFFWVTTTWSYFLPSFMIFRVIREILDQNIRFFIYKLSLYSTWWSTVFFIAQTVMKLGRKQLQVEVSQKNLNRGLGYLLKPCWFKLPMRHTQNITRRNQDFLFHAFRIRL